MSEGAAGGSEEGQEVKENFVGVWDRNYSKL